MFMWIWFIVVVVGLTYGNYGKQYVFKDKENDDEK